ncbi:hypothetical protein QAD02_008491 [Eretmocerus hayati]|uniref:Uncharacterized protein n=1 Tax=Eretmocerus hayati TaxID=131215 RepID=A0ACC2N923_9HYME|nr:hypothetical protein QAD02_008491 [Eretmocerus hayati]
MAAGALGNVGGVVANCNNTSTAEEVAASRLLLLRPDDDRDSPGPSVAPIHELATLRPLAPGGVGLSGPQQQQQKQQGLAQLSPIPSNMLSQPLPPQAKMQVLAEAACSRSPQTKLVRRPAAGSRRPSNKAQPKALFAATANQQQQPKIAQNHKVQRQQQGPKLPLNASNLVLASKPGAQAPPPLPPQQQQAQKNRAQHQPHVLFKLGASNNSKAIGATRIVNTNAVAASKSTPAQQAQIIHNNRLGQLSPQTMAMIQQQVVVVTPMNTLHHKPAGSIKTLVPVQHQPVTVAGVVASNAGRNTVVQQRFATQPIKMQQVQHKQVTATPAMQYTQQQTARTLTGQMKNLTPVEVATALRRDVEIKAEIKAEVKTEVKAELKTEIKEEEKNFSSQTLSQVPTSPQRRMPLPYECLQFQVNILLFLIKQLLTIRQLKMTQADSVTRCICDFVHDDGYMICCDKCLVWQHVDCMGIDRGNIPDEYLCEICRPRRVDRARARALQMRKREELLNSDTSSDSSSSSGDTERGNAVNVKGRKAQQQQSGVRRKPDPLPQSRRINNNNNNNVAKRQRRDTQSRQTSNSRNKKEPTAPTTTPQQQTANKQKAPAKRKTKRRASLEDKIDESPDAWGSNMAPLRHWIERYEEAVTNHYSPELRAKISSIKINGAHNDLKQNNISAAATGKCRLNIQSNNHRYLVSTMYLPPNTPVVELRGKYMLSTQHRPSHPQSRQHSQRPGPFVFFYRLPRDGTEVCVDTRTYGNEARFIRRSCKPNAEVKHCIEKGTLHLYIVTTTAIDKNVEITIRHDQHDLLLSPNSNSAMLPILCACNNVKDCGVANLTVTPPSNRKGMNGPLAENADGRERRRRGRKNTVTEENEVETSSASPLPPVVSTPTPPITPIPSQPSAKKTVTITTNVTPIKESPPVNTSVITSNHSSTTSTAVVTRSVAKEEHEHQITTAQHQPGPSSSQQSSEKFNKSPSTSLSSPQHTPTENTKKEKDKRKMTREERKMEAIMKAFERLEKAEQRKQEVQARNAQRKESGTHSDNEDSGPGKPKPNMNDKPLRRKRRKGRTRSTSTSHSQSSRRTRLNSAESDLTSGDESSSMQSPPQSQSCSYALRMHGSKDHGNIGNSQAAAGLLLALANSNATGSRSPTSQQHHHHHHHHHHHNRHPTPVKSPSGDSGASSSSQSSTPSTPLSSACLLVAAAVGPLAPGFKFPKTKKLLMNEWLKETPESQSQSTELSSTESSEFLSQNYASKGLATLVQAASSVSNVCDSTPQKICSSAPTGSAKKRWLRQAISEECDSPNSSRPESPPTIDRVAPPKKRRIARESLSSDNYTPPTTPTMMQQDHIPPHRPSINEDDFIDHLPSPSTEDVCSQNEYDSDQVKDETRSRFNLKNDTESTCKFGSLNPSNLSRTRGETKFTPIVNLKEELKSEDEMNNSESKSRLDTSIVSPKSSRRTRAGFCQKFEQKVIKVEEEEILRGTVEIVDQNDQDLETDEFSSPIAAMESEAELKKRVAELSLEFGGGIAALENMSSDFDGSFQNQNESSCVKSEQDRDEDKSIDEFDVEAQMKRITGDDGDDYKEKMEDSAEKDKTVDGIEGLMESSQEDSESDRENDDKDANFQDSIDETSEKLKEEMIEDNSANAEQIFENSGSENTDMSSVKECDVSKKTCELPENEPKHRDEPFWEKSKSNSLERITDPLVILAQAEWNDHLGVGGTLRNEKTESAAISALEESMMELDSMELPVEDVPEEPVKIFPSIPPLSERIRKKTDSNPAPKSKLEIEASIIESSLELSFVSSSDDLKNREELTTAFKELLEVKIEPEDTAITESVNTSSKPPSSISLKNDTIVPEVEYNTEEQAVTRNAVPPFENDVRVSKTPRTSITKGKVAPPEPKRLKDPRTAVPNKPTKPPREGPAPIKRKLSITEYRKRMQQSSELPCETDSLDMSGEGKGTTRDRSNSASSGTSSLSSDEESVSKAPLEIPSLGTLPIFANADTDDKKGDDGTTGWSAAPTLVERQRENLTERLKREFGLFLNDDEEERARKLAMNADAPSKTSTVAIVNCTDVSYPPPQLPPHPYIPPPGSAPIHFTQFPPPPKPTHPPVAAFPDYSVPPPSIVNPNFPPPPIVKPPIVPPPIQPVTAPQFVLPQAPPGSNPYPPAQFSTPPPPVQNIAVVPSPATTTVSISRFSPATVPPQPPLQTPSQTQPVMAYTVPPPPLPQVQKAAYSHPAPRT